MKYFLFLKKTVMVSDLILAMHTCIPEWNVVLTKFYSNLVNIVNGINNNKVLYAYQTLE